MGEVGPASEGLHLQKEGGRKMGSRSERKARRSSFGLVGAEGDSHLTDLPSKNQAALLKVFDRITLIICLVTMTPKHLANQPAHQLFLSGNTSSILNAALMLLVPRTPALYRPREEP